MSADVAQGPAGPRYRGRRRVADPASRRRLSVLAIVACGSLASAVALALVGSNRYPGQPHGGKIVRNIGAWGGAAGVLRFGSVTVPADGTYTLAFFYVHLDDQPSRTAVITVAGQDPISVPVTGGSICCVTKVITVVLTKGANVVTFTNPGGQAPSIDKIVIGTP